MIKLVCLSDTHSKHKQVIVPDGDILIHAGDLTPRGNYHEFISVGNWFQKMRERFKHVIFIAGNHDWAFQFNAPLMARTFFQGCHYLQDDAIELMGIKFYGSPRTPNFYNWAFMDEDEDLAPYWSRIPDDTEVLITHGPPFSILDFEANQNRCGSRSLYECVKQLPKLKHHIFGHIHESYGTEKIDDVTFYNVASLNGNYQYANAPQVIEITV